MMKSKKIISALLVLGIIGSVFIGYKVCVKVNNGENIKQEVIYTAKDNLKNSSESYKITGDESEEYKELSKQILKRYFNITDEDYDGLTFRASRISEKTLTEMQLKMKKQTQEAYDNNKIFKEEYEEEMEMCNGGPKDAYENSKKVIRDKKHNQISVVWVNQDKAYSMNFNATTNEIEDVNISQNEKGSKPLTLSEEELKNISENFIKDKKLSDMENLNFENLQESKINDEEGNEIIDSWWVSYNYKNNSSEKVMIGINAYLGKVNAFILS